MENQEKKGRSNPGTQTSPNPAKMFIEWKSEEKSFSYYDKESKENVAMKMPTTFIPVYICSTVKGYNHKKTKTYIANEVDNLQTDILTVTSYNHTTKERKVEHQGLYADIKEDFDQNIKFTVSLYAGIKNADKKLDLVNFQLRGAGLHHWFDFVKKNDIWKFAVKVAKSTEEVNGKVTYNAPVFETLKISEEMDIEAGVLQDEIKAYLKEYFAKNSKEVPKLDEKQDNGLNESKKEVKKDSKRSEPKVEEELPPISHNLDDDLGDEPF